MLPRTGAAILPRQVFSLRSAHDVTDGAFATLDPPKKLRKAARKLPTLTEIDPQGTPKPSGRLHTSTTMRSRKDQKTIRQATHFNANSIRKGPEIHRGSCTNRRKLCWKCTPIAPQMDAKSTAKYLEPTRTGCPICACRPNPVFRPLGRCAPVAVNSGLRPETL